MAAQPLGASSATHESELDARTREVYKSGCCLCGRTSEDIQNSFLSRLRTEESQSICDDHRREMQNILFGMDPFLKKTNIHKDKTKDKDAPESSPDKLDDERPIYHLKGLYRTNPTHLTNADRDLAYSLNIQRMLEDAVWFDDGDYSEEELARFSKTRANREFARKYIKSLPHAHLRGTNILDFLDALQDEKIEINSLWDDQLSRDWAIDDAMVALKKAYSWYCWLGGRERKPLDLNEMHAKFGVPREWINLKLGEFDFDKVWLTFAQRVL